jgi:thiamine-monophosphate kinase
MENNIPAFTPLSELGEFGLIDRLTKSFIINNESSIKGIGDDAAVLNYPDKHIVITTDVLAEGIHFDLTYVPLKHLGYKAVVVNLSDVCAMNAIPRQITVSLAISDRYSVEALEELYSGIYLACQKYKVDLVGGDTCSSIKGMFISVTAIGEVERGKEVYRNGAKVTDLIVVSGDLGAAYMGLQLLEREKTVFNGNPHFQPELTGFEYILQRQLKPEARTDVIQFLQPKGIQPTSMIDISDGLSSEILHICKQSGVGCRLYEEKIPVHTETIQLAREMNIDPTLCALHGGEDYELLFTVSLNDFEAIKKISGLFVIGYITDKSEGQNLIAKDGTAVPLTAQGWNSFKE